NPVLFPDSAIARKMSLGLTKCQAIATNVLAPASVTRCISTLQELIIADGSLDTRPSFSVATDAANHGNIKLYPLAV
ncbi:hypothetical protein HPB47_009253, partial [Ixodes persulcatus]